MKAKLNFIAMIVTPIAPLLHLIFKVPPTLLTFFPLFMLPFNFLWFISANWEVLK